MTENFPIFNSEEGTTLQTTAISISSENSEASPAVGTGVVPTSVDGFSFGDDMGWIKVPQDFFDRYSFSNKPEYVSIWLAMMFKCKREPYPFTWEGEPVVMKPGQIIVGKGSLSRLTGIPEAKVYKILKWFEKVTLITRRSKAHSTMVTMLTWRDEQELDSEKGTPKERKGVPNETPMEPLKEVDLEVDLKEETTTPHVPSEQAKGRAKPFVSKQAKELVALYMSKYSGWKSDYKTLPTIQRAERSCSTLLASGEVTEDELRRIIEEGFPIMLRPEFKSPFKVTNFFGQDARWITLRDMIAKDKPKQAEEPTGRPRRFNADDYL